MTAEALLSRSDKALYQAKTWRGGHVFARDLAVAAEISETKPAAQPRAA
jgi:diguanylate cyclase